MIDQQRPLSDANRSQSLDLSESNPTATIQPRDLAQALWVLSAPKPPTKIILPSSLLVRRRLARAGLMFAADRRGVPLEIEGEPVSVTEALGLASVRRTLALAQFDQETEDRMRVVFRLESRKPPTADPDGLRYHWINGLGVAPRHMDRMKRESFARHADQCFFEPVDNVHRWSRARRALAVVSATAGGGDESHNRLQIVVADDGIGIVESARQKAQSLADRGQPSTCLSYGNARTDLDTVVDVVSDLVESVFDDRAVVGARGGHGLATIAKHVSRWDGTMNVISAFAPDRVMHLGRRGQSGSRRHQEFTMAGVRGTLVHLTLDAKRDAARSPEALQREPVAV